MLLFFFAVVGKGSLVRVGETFYSGENAVDSSTRAVTT